MKQAPKKGDTIVVNASPSSIASVSITGGSDTFTQTSPGVWTASNVVALTWTPSITVTWTGSVSNPSVTITEYAGSFSSGGPTPSPTPVPTPTPAPTTITPTSGVSLPSNYSLT